MGVRGPRPPTEGHFRDEAYSPPSRARSDHRCQGCRRPRRGASSVRPGGRRRPHRRAVGGDGAHEAASTRARPGRGAGRPGRRRGRRRHLDQRPAGALGPGRPLRRGGLGGDRLADARGDRRRRPRAHRRGPCGSEAARLGGGDGPGVLRDRHRREPGDRALRERAGRPHLQARLRLLSPARLPRRHGRAPGGAAAPGERRVGDGRRPRSGPRPSPLPAAGRPEGDRGDRAHRRGGLQPRLPRRLHRAHGPVLLR